MRRTRQTFAALLSLGAGLGQVPGVRACSVCRCGDPTFSALGVDVYGSDRFRLACDWERFDKSQATEASTPESGPGHESMVEDRVTLLASCTVSGRLNAVARIPYSQRELTETSPGPAPITEGTSTRGLSDPEFYALMRLWAAPFAPGLGQRAWVSGLAGIKAPWGRNDLAEEGERLDEHAQSGTGSTDLFAGFSGVYLLTSMASALASIQYRWMGTNDSGYRYGDLLLTNLGIERKLGTRFDGVLEVNYRHAERDRVDASGALDPNTGGGVLYLTPRLQADLGRGIVARGAAQIPVLHDLEGDQTERAVLNFGVTYLLR